MLALLITRSKYSTGLCAGDSIFMNEILFQLIIFVMSVVSSTLIVCYWNIRNSAVRNNDHDNKYTREYARMRRYAISITTSKNTSHIEQIFRMYFYRIRHGTNRYKSICRIGRELREQYNRNYF